MNHLNALPPVMTDATNSAKRQSIIKRVLIAEDNMDLRIIFAHAFNKERFEVITAVDGQEALDLLDASAPDIAILDVDMPKISGLQVLAKIRQKPHMSTMKVIILTGNMMARHVPGADEADLFLVKPVNIHELVTMADRLIKSSQRA